MLGGDFPPITAGDRGPLGRDAEFFDIAHRTGRMVVSITNLEFFGRNLIILLLI